MNQMFTPMVQSVFRALAEPIELNDQIATGERRMLQRQYYNFIATIVTSNVMEVLSAEENSAILHQVMLSVIQGSVEFPDPVVIINIYIPTMELQLIERKNMISRHNELVFQS